MRRISKNSALLTPLPSYHQLQHDVYSALKRLLGRSIMVSNRFWASPSL
jgi:hypothetical protein